MIADELSPKQKTEDNTELDLSNYSGIGKEGKKKGYTIDAKAENDTVIGSMFDDVITAGGGTTVAYDANLVYGNDKINLTKGENLQVTVDNHSWSNDLRVAKNGKDVEYVSTTYDENTKVTYSATGTTTGEAVELGTLKGIKYTKEIVAFNDETEKWEKTTYNWTKDAWKKGSVKVLKNEEEIPDSETIIYIAKGAGVDIKDSELEDSENNLLADREVYAVYATTQTKSWGIVNSDEDDPEYGMVTELAEPAENAKVLRYSEEEIEFETDFKSKYTMKAGDDKPVAITAADYKSLTDSSVEETDFLKAVDSTITIVNAAKSGAESVEIAGHDILNDTFNAVTVKGSKVTGTAYGDSVDLLEEADAGEKIQINLGTGRDEILYEFGFDDGVARDLDITLNKGEVLGILGGGSATYGYDEKGKEAVARYTDNEVTSTFTFKGLASKNILASADDLQLDGENVIDQNFEAFQKENKNGGKDFKGSWLNDSAEGTEGNDTFKLGTGANSIAIDTSNNIGVDTVTLSKGESLTLNFSDDSDVSYWKEGNDIVAKIATVGAVDEYQKLETEYTDATADVESYKLTVTSDLSEVTEYELDTETGKWVAEDESVFTKAPKGAILTYTVKFAEDENIYNVTDLAGKLFKTKSGKTTVQDVDLQIKTVTTTNYVYGEYNTKKYYKEDENSIAMSLVEKSAANVSAVEYAQKIGTEVLAFNTIADEFAYLIGDEDNEKFKKNTGIVSLDGNGKIIFKDYANNKTDAAVMTERYGDMYSIWDDFINIIATSPKTEGTLGRDEIMSELKKNTFVKKYQILPESTCDMSIFSAEGAVDTIQIMAADKNTKKLKASDFRFDLSDDVYSEYGSIYAAYEDEDAYSDVSFEYYQQGLADNLANLTFQDATNAKYQFLNATTDGEVDLSQLDKKVYKNNLIVWAYNASTIKDSAKNDIIDGGYEYEGSRAWYYTSGSDVYTNQSYSNDTYNVAITKNTDLTIRDCKGEEYNYDVLNLNIDSLAGKKSTAEDAFINKAAIKFDVFKDGNDYMLGFDLVITAKDDKSFGKGVKMKGFFDNYTTFSLDEDGKWKEETGHNYSDMIQGAYGCIETINVVSKDDCVGEVDMQTWVTTIAANVAGWLTDNGFESTEEVYLEGSKADIKSLAALYTSVDGTLII